MAKQRPNKFVETDPDATLFKVPPDPPSTGALTEESRIGRTPNGGVRSTAYYFRADGLTPCDKKEAKAVEIVEFDARGEIVARTRAEMEGAD